MKTMIFSINILLVFVFMFCPFTASSHPGKTDIRDGHKCWKNCDEWGLERGEYHLHDKNRAPIRLNKEGNPVGDQPVEAGPQKSEPPEVTKPQEAQVQSQAEKAPDQTAAPKVAPPVLREESVSYLPFLSLAFIVLCLLAILVLIRRKRKF